MIGRSAPAAEDEFADTGNKADLYAWAGTALISLDGGDADNCLRRKGRFRA
jgi:hypothetical protein